MEKNISVTLIFVRDKNYNSHNPVHLFIYLFISGRKWKTRGKRRDGETSCHCRHHFVQEIGYYCDRARGVQAMACGSTAAHSLFDDAWACT